VKSGRQTASSRLREYLERRVPGEISEAEWADLRACLAPVSPGYLRRLLRASGLPLAPLVEGVRQGSFEELERTLLALGREYAAAREAGARDRQEACRRLVIEAKDHARWAARRAADAAKKAVKKEMADWMLVWLEDPSVFPTWVRLRKRARGDR